MSGIIVYGVQWVGSATTGVVAFAGIWGTLRSTKSQTNGQKEIARLQLENERENARAERQEKRLEARYHELLVKVGQADEWAYCLFMSWRPLAVYSDTANAFHADAENVGLLLAAHAAIALSDARKAANLYTAVESRDLIGQAKGILMERYKIDAARAFDLLILSSQHTNIKLRDIAEHLTTTGELAAPTATEPRRR